MIWKHNFFFFQVLGNIVVYLVEESRNVKLGRKLQEGKLETIQHLSVPFLQLGSFMELCGQLNQTRSEKQSQILGQSCTKGRLLKFSDQREREIVMGKMTQNTWHLSFLVSQVVAVSIVLLLSHEGSEISIGNLLKTSEFWNEERLDPNPGSDFKAQLLPLKRLNVSSKLSKYLYF